MYNVQQEDIDILRQREKTIYVKIQLLNDKFMAIAEIEGDFIDGSLSVDSTSDIRRTFDGTIYVRNKTYWTSSTGLVWIDKHVRVYVGIKHQRTQKILWYPCGIFNFMDNSFDYDATTSTLRVSCEDMVSSLNGDLGGVLIGSATQVKAGEKIRDVIVQTVTQLGGITKYRIEYEDATVPEDMEWSTGATVWDMLTELRDLYYSYEMFFDEEGTFVCQRIPMNSEEPIVLDDNILHGLVISESLSNSFSDIKNMVEIFGKSEKVNVHSITKLVGHQPTKAEIAADKANNGCNDFGYIVNPDSPYTIDKIGERILSCSGGDFDDIRTVNLALQRGEYEIFKGARLPDSVSIECIMIPWLGVNNKIGYKLQMKGGHSVEQYMVSGYNFDFTSGTMSISMYRFYPFYPFSTQKL